jgi:signal peptidase I
MKDSLEMTSAGPIAGAARFQFPTFRAEERKSYIAVCILLWSAIAYLFFSHFIMMAVEIKGSSMFPTLKDGQRYLLLRCPYLWRSPKQGEIVVIRDPEDHNLSIKRLVGMPGDLFQIKNDGVYLNGTKYEEPYLTTEAILASGHKLVKPRKLGPKEYFVMGDNRDWSADSRTYGPVPRDFILGTISKPNPPPREPSLAEVSGPGLVKGN